MSSQDLVGQRIKAVRRQRGLSQAQLAHPELSDSYVSLIESGKRTPTPAVLELLAAKLECSLTYLLNGVTAEQLEELELGLRFARLALENGEVEEARTRFAELRADPNLAGLAQLRLDTEYGYALAVEACGDLTEAIEVHERLLESTDENLTTERRLAIALALCRCYRERGDLSAAVRIGEEALGRPDRNAWSDELVELGATLLLAYIERGDLLRPGSSPGSCSPPPTGWAPRGPPSRPAGTRRSSPSRPGAATRPSRWPSAPSPSTRRPVTPATSPASAARTPTCCCGIRPSRPRPAGTCCCGGGGSWPSPRRASPTGRCATSSSPGRSSPSATTRRPPSTPRPRWTSSARAPGAPRRGAPRARPRLHGHGPEDEAAAELAAAAEWLDKAPVSRSNTQSWVVAATALERLQDVEGAPPPTSVPSPAPDCDAGPRRGGDRDGPRPAVVSRRRTRDAPPALEGRAVPRLGWGPPHRVGSLEAL